MVLREVRDMLNRAVLACTINEVQEPKTSPDVEWPLLCILIKTIIMMIPSLIISGTGMSLQVVEEVAGSCVGKEESLVQYFKDIGRFDMEREQQEYMECSFPKGIIDTDPWKAVASCVAYWFCGQYVICCVGIQDADMHVYIASLPHYSHILYTQVFNHPIICSMISSSK